MGTLPFYVTTDTDLLPAPLLKTASMAANMFLFWGSGSPPTWKVMVALEEKGLGGYPNKLISFSKREHKSPEVLKINPRGQSPSFRDGDVIVNQSAAILDYLEYKFADQGTQLLPTDPAARGRVLQLTHEVPMLNEKFFAFRSILNGKPEDINKEALEEKKKAFKEELQRWEDALKKQGEGSWLAGKDFTMADIHMVVPLGFGARNGLQLTSYPALAKYSAQLLARPSVAKTS